MRPIEWDIGRFGHLWLTGEHAGRGLLLDDSYGAKPGLNLDQLRELPVPMPPLAEQHRIVTRVDELMGLCDWLGERLTKASGTRGAFASAAGHHLDA